MFKQKLVTFALYILMLTLGASGLVAAYNGGLTLETQAANEPQVPEPAPPAEADAESIEKILDYDWHEFGPFKTLQTADGEVIVDRLHVYFKTEDDIFTGRITALQGIMDHEGMDGKELNVQFIRNNAVVASTALQSDGTFEIVGLEQGPYDIRVLSGNSLYLSSFVLSTKEDLAAAGYSDEEIERVYLAESQRPFQLEAAGCITDDYELAVELLNEAWEFSKHVNPPPKFPEWHHLHIPKKTFFDAAEGGTSLLRHTVRLDQQGVLHGQLRKPVDLPTEQVGVKHIGGIEVFFLHKGRVTTRTFSNEEGQFTIPGLKPGNYSVVARSPYAVGVIGVRVIEFGNHVNGVNLLDENNIPIETVPGEAGGGTIEEADPQSSVPTSHLTTPVSSLLQPEGAPNLSLDMSLASPFELPVPPVPENAPAAGFGGGGGGGGGPFFIPPFWWNNGGGPVSPAAPQFPPPPPPVEEI